MSEITVTEHLLLHQKRSPQATGQFTGLLYDLILSAKIISRRVNKAGLLDILGGTGEVNVQGENVQKLDEIAIGCLFIAWNDAVHCVPWAPKKMPSLSAWPPNFRVVIIF